jgi:hypothetical protein
VVVALRLAGEASYSYYPTLGDPATPAALAAAATAALALLFAHAVFVRWPSPS